jgi:hypothetical protein
VRYSKVGLPGCCEVVHNLASLSLVIICGQIELAAADVTSTGYETLKKAVSNDDFVAVCPKLSWLLGLSPVSCELLLHSDVRVLMLRGKVSVG